MEDDFTISSIKCGRGKEGDRCRRRPFATRTQPGRFIALLLSLALLLTRASGMCPSQCECNDLELRASCSNSSLEIVPILFNPDVKHINLSLNKINSIHYTLEFYTRLVSIDISFNKIQNLGSSNFQWQLHLKSLDLSYNSIQQLKKDVFKGLKQLRQLNLSNNEIERIAPNAFHDLHQLESLHLSDNNLVSFEEDLFKYLTNLRLLELDNNQILDIPTNNIKYTSSLETLSLGKNLIEYISKESFPAMKSLRHLSLETNVISDIHSQSLDGLLSLENLDLSNNNLTKILTIQLSKLSNLTSLNLSGNYFDSIPPVAFRGLFKLQSLHLDRIPNLIRIDQRAFVDNIKLERVTFDDNREMRTLPTRLFHRNPRLLHISIVDNNLSTLESTHFPLDQLQTLRLGGNPFECNCSLRWLWELGRSSSEVNDTAFTLDSSRISCAAPDYLAGKPLILVDESDISCSMNWIAVAALSTCSTCTLFILLVIVFYFKRLRCDEAMSSRTREARPTPASQAQAVQAAATSLGRGPSTAAGGKRAPQSAANDFMNMPPPWEQVPSHFNSNIFHYNCNAKETYLSSKPHIVYV